MTKSKNLKAFNFDDEEENCFYEGDVQVDNPVMSFNFAPSPAAPVEPQASSFKKMSFSTPQRGATPSKEGEDFTLSRSYKLRPSTMRKLNEIKANYPEVSVYLNTIVDEAICHYYEHFFSRRAKS